MLKEDRTDDFTLSFATLRRPKGFHRPMVAGQETNYTVPSEYIAQCFLPQIRKEAVIENVPTLVHGGDEAQSLGIYPLAWVLYDTALSVVFSQWLRNRTKKWPKDRRVNCLDLVQKLRAHGCLTKSGYRELKAALAKPATLDKASTVPIRELAHEHLEMLLAKPSDSTSN